MGKHKKLTSLLIIGAFVAASLGGLFALPAQTAYALNEQYTWHDANTITATGGRYGNVTVTYTATRSYNPGKTNTPTFNSERFDDQSGCQFYAQLVFSGKSTSAAKVSPDNSTTLSGGCDQSVTNKYSKAAVFKGSPTATSNTAKNRTITVIVRATDKETYTKDTITLKEGAGGKKIGTKKVSGKSTYTADGYMGYKVMFKGLVSSLTYEACSATFGQCGSAGAIPINPLPADILKGNEIMITQDVDAEDATTCAIDGIGWIICPVMNFMAELNDQAFGFLQGFLDIKPKLITDSATYSAWAAFRDIANVLFVIAFLVIVYSQITSAGISNYGIKRMLPRLFIAAVLVNISFFLCAIAVDISNILGASIYSFFQSIEVSGGGTGGTSTWATVMGPVLVAGIGVALLVVFVISLPALLAFALVILILIARQAFVILLIVMAPIAFVAYLLPNTEQWFKKWWKAFSAVLMVYLVVALVFGASTLASKILFKVSGDDQQMLAIIALGVLAIPLFAIPLILKSSLAAAGSVGARLSGMADKAQGRAAKKGADRLRERGKDLNNRWKIAAANQNGAIGKRFGGITRYKARRDSLRSSRESEATRSTNSYVANQLGEKDDEGNYTERAQRLQNAAAGGSVVNKADQSARVRAAAVATQGMHKQFDDDVSAFKTTMTDKSNDELITMIENGNLSSEQRAAAGGLVMSRNHRESHIRALDAVTKQMNKAEGTNPNEVESLSNVQKQMAHDMKDKPWALGDQATGQLVTGDLGKMHDKVDGLGNVVTDSSGNAVQVRVEDMQKEINHRVGTKLSAASLANMNPDELKRIRKAAVDGNLNNKQKASLKAAIEDARSNPQINNLIKPEAKLLHDEMLNKIAKDDQDAAAATYGPNI